jgi:hypothetical protein
MSEICVAHLVREKNGIAPFRAFLGSYRENSGGVEHDLLIIFKGFDDRFVPAEYSALLDGLSYHTLFLPDEGFDIGPYFHAARTLDYHYFCFLNSFSVLLDENWLAKMYNYVRREGVGVVGATASHESFYSTFLHNWWSNRSKWLYRGMLGNEYRKIREVLTYRKRFPPFPNHHLRSNAFIIPRELMLKLNPGPLKEKIDAHEFESGRESMTRQILALHLKALVVGRDGRAYEKENWGESFTFKSGDQRNLLVADNQTRRYADADARTQQALTQDAWGRV